MTDIPETSMVQINGNQWMSEREAQRRGLRPIPEATPAQPAVTIGDRIFEFTVMIVIVIISTYFYNGLYQLVWGH